MTELAGRSVLVTGANRGMGREYLNQLLDRGVATVYAGARNPESVDVRDSRVVPVALDVTDDTSVRNAVGSLPDVSVLINNAGIARAQSVLEPDTSALRLELETNLFGPLRLVSGFADQLASHTGAVVNVASVLSWIGVGGSYGVSKAALWSATDALRNELTPRGVQVVGVYVGYVDTDMTATVAAAKSDPAEVVRQVLDGIEQGAVEVLADDISRTVRANLPRPIHEQLERLFADA